MHILCNINIVYFNMIFTHSTHTVYDFPLPTKTNYGLHILTIDNIFYRHTAGSDKQFPFFLMDDNYNCCSFNFWISHLSSKRICLLLILLFQLFLPLMWQIELIFKPADPWGTTISKTSIIILDIITLISIL